jgi:hypothetical protein
MNEPVSISRAGFLFEADGLAGAVFVKALFHLFFQPLRNWFGAKCLAHNFVHYFKLTPFRMIASEFLFSDLAVELADFQTKQDLLLPGHERLHKESAIPVTPVADSHGAMLPRALAVLAYRIHVPSCRTTLIPRPLNPFHLDFRMIGT